MFTGQDKLLIDRMFGEGITVKEIGDVLNLDKKAVLLYLTKSKNWSQYCGSCSIKRCYECPGLVKLGRLDIQDCIDLLAQNKGAI